VIRDRTQMALGCAPAVAAILLLTLPGCTTLRAVETINEAVSKASALAMPAWDEACKAKATDCNRAGHMTRETCPTLVRCEADQDAAYAVANAIHAAAAAVALASAAGKDPDLGKLAAQLAGKAATFYDLLRKAGFLGVLP